MEALIASPHWTLVREGNLLVLTAGGDESYLLDDIDDPALVARIHAAHAAGRLAELAADPACRGVVEQLRRIGAVLPASCLAVPQSLGLRWFGQPLPDFAGKLAANAGIAPQAEGTPDVWLLVRTNASWEQTLAAYRQDPPRQPHLFVDLAYHHTLSLGPYVVPGETACLSCLANRIAQRWGDPPLPPLPAANAEADVVIAVLKHSLLAGAGERQAPVAFIERVVSLDLTTLQTQRNRLFQLPGCPVCRPPQPGRDPLVLPWAAAAAPAL